MGSREAKFKNSPPSILLWVVLEPSLQEHRLALVHYLLEAISENPGIIKYTEIALL